MVTLWFVAFPAFAGIPLEQADERVNKLWLEGSKLVLQGQAGEALERYRKIVRLYPQTKIAPAAQLKIGELFSGNREFEEAFNAYQDVIDKFPASNLFTPAIEGQFAVVQRVLIEDRRYQRRRADRPKTLPSLETASEMLKRILRNGRYAPFSPDVQYQLAVTLDRQGDDRQAIEEFWRFLANYAEDDLADDAAFQIGFVEYRKARANNRELLTRQRARFAFEYFLQAFPLSEKVPEAHHLLVVLAEWNVEALTQSGRLYEKSGATAAALKHYTEALGTSRDEEAIKRLAERILKLHERQSEADRLE